MRDDFDPSLGLIVGVGCLGAFLNIVIWIAILAGAAVIIKEFVL